MITKEQLGRIVDRMSYRPKEAEIVDALNVGMMEADINTPLRTAMFLAQVLTETGGFKWFVELGNFAYFQKYEHRSNLGNNQIGDGPRFKGRGFIQITGRANYTKAGKALGLDLVGHPELAEGLVVGARVAGWYWETRRLNDYADVEDIREVTRRINGGYNGLTERLSWYAKARNVLVDPPIVHKVISQEPSVPAENIAEVNPPITRHHLANKKRSPLSAVEKPDVDMIYVEEPQIKD